MSDAAKFTKPERTSKYDENRGSYMDAEGNYVYTTWEKVGRQWVERPLCTIPLGENGENAEWVIMLDSDDHDVDLQNRYQKEKLSHLMDAETWMDANKAVELGFADGILFTRDSQSGGETEGIAGFSQEKTGTKDSVMFSRRAVNNALVNKLEKHYGKRSQPVKDQAAISDPAGVNVSKDPCYGCFGAAENACRNCEKGRVDNTGQATGQDNGRSADELRERLSFIKKFI